MADPFIRSQSCALVRVSEIFAFQHLETRRVFGEEAGIPRCDVPGLRTAHYSPSHLEGADPVLDVALPDEIAALGRPSLILCGGLLEGALSRLAINALLNGLNIFIVVDGVLSLQPDLKDIMLLRLMGCGAQLTSRLQVLLELYPQAEDEFEKRSIEDALRELAQNDRPYPLNGKAVF